MMVGASSRTSVEHVAAEAVLVGRRMAGLEDAAIDAAAQVLDEGTEQAGVGVADHDVASKLHVSLAHRGLSVDWQVRWAAARSVGASGSSTAPFSCVEYGCCGLSSTARASPAFDHAAVAHDDHAVADVVGGGQVVRDVDDRHAEIVAQRAEQVDDRHAQRRIDHRHRLVGHDQRGPRDQRARDGDALQLAARQLVRIASAHLGQRQADLAQRARRQRCSAASSAAPAKRRAVMNR